MQQPHCLEAVTDTLAKESFQQCLMEHNEAASWGFATSTLEATWEKTWKCSFEMLTSERWSLHQWPIRTERWHFLWIIDDLQGRWSFEGPSRWSQVLHIWCDIKRKASSGMMRGLEGAKWQHGTINFATAWWRAGHGNFPPRSLPPMTTVSPVILLSTVCGVLPTEPGQFFIVCSQIQDHVCDRVYPGQGVW